MSETTVSARDSSRAVSIGPGDLVRLSCSTALHGTEYGANGVAMLRLNYKTGSILQQLMHRRDGGL